MELLKTTGEWSLLLERSAEEPFIVFKHSSACPVSQRAYDAVREAVRKGQFVYRTYGVTVQTGRDISDRITEDLSVKHETPQVLVVKAGRAVYTASHFRIDPAGIAGACA